MAHTNLRPAALTASSGSVNQVLSIVAGAPAWASVYPTAFTTQMMFVDDFTNVSTNMGFVDLATPQGWYVVTSGTVGSASFSYVTSAAGGVVQFPQAANSSGTVSLATSGLNPLGIFFSTLNLDFIIRMQRPNNSTGIWRIGLGSTLGTWSAEPTDGGLYFRSSSTTGNIQAISLTSSGLATVVNTGVGSASTSMNTFRIIITSSGTTGTVYANGSSQGTAFTSSQLPLNPLALQMGTSGSTLAGAIYLDAWQIIQDRAGTV